MPRYIVDSNSLSAILNHYYPDRFPSFWNKFNNYVRASDICSVREVYNELLDRFDKKRLVVFTIQNKDFFAEPDNAELQFITKIYSISHFQHNLENKKLLKGGPFADPFVIAKAYILSATVVTEEHFKPNGAKIPNICQHFGISFTSLEGFLQKENWSF
ncbi:MAG TPA: DUF4411 family protein [Bacteroidales bacterium]|nr:DUF4411 family protein [Bacteroidales bacterium]HPM10828.1 DUF4411 family protein [Paludibacter sp.]